MLDLLFQNAAVVDGSGRPAFRADIGVRDGRIVLNPAGEEARETVDAAGKYLCPGFIDSHSHGDMSIGTIHGPLCKVSQGVTTEIGGQCGQSAFPADRRFLPELRGILAFSPDFLQMPYERFTSFDAYAAYAGGLDMPINMFSMIGHNTLRVSVMGVADRAPTAEEMDRMKERLREAMEQGAMGLSSGLIYIPGVYTTTEEVIELCKVIRPYGGVYATHMRNEAKDVVKSVREAIHIAEQAGVPLVISHHKVCGRAYWGQAEETLRLVDEAVARGVNVMIDQYPYEANMTALNVCIPPQYFSDGLPALLEKVADPAWRKRFAEEMNDPDGGYDNFYLNSGGFTGVFVSASPKVPEAAGMTIADYAQKLGKDPMETYFDLVLDNEGAGEGIFFAMDPREVEKIYCHPRTMVGSDGLCFALNESGHPRAWGTFVRPLRLFSKEEKLVPFEEAVRKQTGLTADFWGLAGKGYIRDGCDADLVLIDYDALYDRATYADSNRPADGIEAVYVSGECVYRGKALTGACPGRLLRRNHKREGGKL